jgi:hypothetical protein
MVVSPLPHKKRNVRLGGEPRHASCIPLMQDAQHGKRMEAECRLVFSRCEGGRWGLAANRSHLRRESWH